MLLRFRFVPLHNAKEHPIGLISHFRSNQDQNLVGQNLNPIFSVIGALHMLLIRKFGGEIRTHDLVSSNAEVLN